jgi:hypothetical protein
MKMIEARIEELLAESATFLGFVELADYGHKIDFQKLDTEQWREIATYIAKKFAMLEVEHNRLASLNGRLYKRVEDWKDRYEKCTEEAITLKSELAEARSQVKPTDASFLNKPNERSELQQVDLISQLAHKARDAAYEITNRDGMSCDLRTCEKLIEEVSWCGVYKYCPTDCENWLKRVEWRDGRMPHTEQRNVQE